MPTPAAGANSAVGYVIETVSGTYQSPTKWLLPETNTMAAKFDKITKNVMSGTLNAARIKRTLKAQMDGVFTYPLYATQGAPIFKAALGVDTYQTALAADTVKAATPITTVNGISTVTLTNTAAVTYVLGAWLQVNTSTSSELRQILTITGNSGAGTIVTVGALVGNAAAAAGTAVQQIGQHKFTTAPTASTLPTLSVEDNQANQYSWKLAGCYVEKFNVKATKDDFLVNLNLFGTKQPVKLATPTTPAPSSAELTDLLHPMSIVDSQVVLYQDPAQTGAGTATSAQQMATYVEDIEFDWSTGLIKKPFHDQTFVYRAFPGPKSGIVKYKYTNASGRPSEFEDYVSSTTNTSIPMTIGAAINFAASGAANWNSVGIYIPSVYLTVATPVRTIADVLTCDIEGELAPQTAVGDQVQFFVCNADVVSY